MQDYLLDLAANPACSAAAGGLCDDLAEGVEPLPLDRSLYLVELDIEVHDDCLCELAVGLRPIPMQQHRPPPHTVELMRRVSCELREGVRLPWGDAALVEESDTHGNNES